jgi:hypothetical protein
MSKSRGAEWVGIVEQNEQAPRKTWETKTKKKTVSLGIRECELVSWEELYTGSEPVLANVREQERIVYRIESWRVLTSLEEIEERHPVPWGLGCCHVSTLTGWLNGFAGVVTVPRQMLRHWLSPRFQQTVRFWSSWHVAWWLFSLISFLLREHS